MISTDCLHQSQRQCPLASSIPTTTYHFTILRKSPFGSIRSVNESKKDRKTHQRRGGPCKSPRLHQPPFVDSNSTRFRNQPQAHPPEPNHTGTSLPTHTYACTCTEQACRFSSTSRLAPGTHFPPYPIVSLLLVAASEQPAIYETEGIKSAVRARKSISNKYLVLGSREAGR